MLHFMGKVKTLWASGGLEAHEGIEVEDVAVAMLEFESGARGVIPGFDRLLLELRVTRIHSHLWRPRVYHDGG